MTDPAPTPTATPAPDERDARHRRWVLAQSRLWTGLLAVAALLVALDRFRPEFLQLAVLLAVASFAWLWRVCDSRARPADLATGARFLLLAACVALAAGRGLDLLLWSGIVLALLGDLLDGWLARRFGGSAGGAILDMECDQFAVLLLSLLGAAALGAGLWLLALPALKTVSVLLLEARGAPVGEAAPVEGSNWRGKCVCAAVMVLLAIAIAPFPLGAVRPAAGLLAVALLAWSFSSDLRHLLPAAARARASA